MADITSLKHLTDQLVIQRNAHLKQDEGKIARAPAVVVYEGELEGRKPIFRVGPVAFVRQDVAEALANGTADEKTVKQFHKETRPQRRELAQWVGTEAEGKQLSNLRNVALLGTASLFGVGGLANLGAGLVAAGGAEIRNQIINSITTLQTMNWGPETAAQVGQTLQTFMNNVSHFGTDVISAANKTSLQAAYEHVLQNPSVESLQGFFERVNGVFGQGIPVNPLHAHPNFGNDPASVKAVADFIGQSNVDRAIAGQQVANAASNVALPLSGALAYFSTAVLPILNRNHRIGEGKQVTELLTQLGDRAAIEGDAAARVSDFIRQSSREEGRLVGPHAEKGIAKAAGAVAGALNEAEKFVAKAAGTIAGLADKEQKHAVEAKVRETLGVDDGKRQTAEDKVLKTLGVNAELEQQRNTLREQLEGGRS